MPNTGNNKRIAKNTFILYIRMFFTMGISLYTSRVVLNTLGIQDYGVYSIVGGIVTLFSFFNGAMTSATQRFLAFDIGKNDFKQLKKTFNATLNIHIIISCFIFVLAETIGLWFVNYKLNLPLNRMDAVNWVYQFSVFTFLFGIIQVPYDALIVAREKMDIYAYMSFLEVFLKLIIVYLLFVFSFDKLILYAGLLFLVSFIVRMGHKYYCKRYYEESKYQFYFDKSLYKVLLSYSGWSLLGSASNIMTSQGINIVLNIFLGVAVNASMGITNQVKGTVFQFISNFQVAFNPQMVKSYAVNEKENFLNLVSKASKYSYFLMLVISMPLILNLDFIFSLWLGDIPKYTLEFCRISIFSLMIDSMAAPLGMSVQATGQIKKYQLIYSIFSIAPLPISYILLKIGSNPVFVLLTVFAFNVIVFIWRIFFLKGHINLSPIKYLKEVIVKVISVTLITLPFPLFIYFSLQDDYKRFILTSVASVSISLISIFFIGLERDERFFISKLIKNKLIKKQ